MSGLEAGLLFVPADFLPEPDTDLGVQRGQGLVEQQHLGLDGQRPRQGHPLLLAAGHLVGVSLGLCREAHEVEHVTGPGTSLGLGHAAQAKPELDASAAQPCVGSGCRLGSPSPGRVCWRGAW